GGGFTLYFTLWRTRRRERRWSLVGSLVVILGIAFVAFALCFIPDMYAPVLGPVNRLVERVIGETPQAKVSSYLALVARGDRDEALALWPASEWPGPEYEERRHSATAELEALGPELSHRVLEIEWWGTCCEPHIITNSREAGFARLWVEVSGGDEARRYVFDVFTRFGYGGRMEGYPVRRWQILDVYPVGEEPLYWRWPGY
ncbi:MAG: hypothetical protein ACE5II_02040, partial [Anaerolineae bacterium]